MFLACGHARHPKKALKDLVILNHVLASTQLLRPGLLAELAHEELGQDCILQVPDGVGQWDPGGWVGEGGGLGGRYLSDLVAPHVLLEMLHSLPGMFALPVEVEGQLVDEGHHLLLVLLKACVGSSCEGLC